MLEERTCLVSLDNIVCYHRVIETMWTPDCPTWHNTYAQVFHSGSQAIYVEPNDILSNGCSVRLWQVSLLPHCWVEGPIKCRDHWKMLSMGFLAIL